MQCKQLLSGIGIVTVILLVVILLPLVVVLFTNKGTKRASLCFIIGFIGSSFLFFIIGLSVNVLYALGIKHLLVTYTSLSYDVCFVISFILGFLVIPNPVYFLRRKNKKSLPAETNEKE